jgi:hypothetical protein
MAHPLAHLSVVLTVLVLPVAPAAGALTQVILTSTPYTSLDAGVTQTVVPTDVTDGPNGSKSATQTGGQSDFFTFGPGLGQTFLGAASVNTRAVAGFGTLKLETYAEATASPTAYGPPFVIGENPYRPVARTSLQVSFSDEIDVEHPSLPDGSPVQFRYRLVVDSTLFGNSQAILRWGLGSTVGGFVSRGEGVQFGFGDHFAIDVPVDAVVGESLPLFVLLGSGGQASAGFDAGREFDSTGFDAFHTATLNLDPVTPGLRLVSDSGQDYATVPEPTGLLIVAAGLLGLGRRRRR